MGGGGVEGIALLLRFVILLPTVLLPFFVLFSTFTRFVTHPPTHLKVRMKRYTDAEDAARERARKQQLAREEAEFQASINAWVSAGQGDVVEKTFTAVAEWQVGWAYL